MKNRIILAVVAVVAIGIMAGCAKVPQEALDSAKAAIEKARTAQADVYFSSEFNALNDSLTVMLQNIETQKSKTAGDFKAVKTSAENIALKAEELAANVEARKEEVKSEAEGLLSNATTLLDEAKALILRAPKGKEGRAVLEEMKNELSVIESSLTEAKENFTSGDNYKSVVDKVNAATDGVNDIIGELKDAMKKAGIKI